MDINNKKKYTDLSYLRSISKGNGDFEQRMLNAFVEQSATDVQRLKNALQAKDWDTIYLIAHKMKPSLQFVGLDVLQPEILQLELASRQKTDLDRVTESVSTVSTIIGIAIEEVREELSMADKNAGQ